MTMTEIEIQHGTAATTSLLFPLLMMTADLLNDGVTPTPNDFLKEDTIRRSTMHDDMALRSQEHFISSFGLHRFSFSIFFYFSLEMRPIDTQCTGSDQHHPSDASELMRGNSQKKYKEGSEQKSKSGTCPYCQDFFFEILGF